MEPNICPINRNQVSTMNGSKTETMLWQIKQAKQSAKIRMIVLIISRTRANEDVLGWPDNRMSRILAAPPRPRPSYIHQPSSLYLSKSGIKVKSITRQSGGEFGNRLWACPWCKDKPRCKSAKMKYSFPLSLWSNLNYFTWSRADKIKWFCMYQTYQSNYKSAIKDILSNRVFVFPSIW